MKRLLTLAIVGLTAACGGMDQASSKTEALSLDTKADLPKCDTSKASLVAYVKAEKAMYTCQDGSWELATQPAAVAAATVAPAATPTVDPTPTPPPFDIIKTRQAVQNAWYVCSNDYKKSRVASFAYVPMQYMLLSGCQTMIDYSDAALPKEYERIQDPLDYSKPETELWYYVDMRANSPTYGQHHVDDFVATFGPQKTEE